MFPAGKAALSDLERALFALPTNLGGLSIPKPTDTASTEFISSCKITAPIVDTIVQQTDIHPNIKDAQHRAKAEVKNKRREAQRSTVNQLYTLLPQTLRQAVDIAKEKGSSSWLAPVSLGSAWLLSSQKHLSRCLMSEIWLAAPTFTYHLHLWPFLHH